VTCQLHALTTLQLGMLPLVPLGWAGSFCDLVWRVWRRGKSLAPPQLSMCWLLTKDSVCDVSCVVMLFRKASAVSAENFELVAENAAGR